MDERDVFILADEALREVVDQIRDDQWGLVVPTDMTPRLPGSTLRRVIGYHAYDDAWVPDVLAGRTIEDVGAAWDGDLLGDHPTLNFTSIVETAVLAVRACDDLDRLVHLSYGDYPAREYLKHITSFRGLRVYDLSRFIRADATMPAALVQGLWDELSPQAEEWRKMGVYGPKVEVPDDAPLQDRLLGLTGRQPG
ncbi:MAG TPA: TIGR03086 family protein [Thermoleophilia bacterium]|nr:TIGR03086 family protein [Thermoleophilia bacterium]